MFDGVLTTDTFVLGWHRETARLVFAVEASLWPGHPEYEPPLAGEWTCYKLAHLVFDGVRAVDGLPDMANVPGRCDPDGSLDYGTLDGVVAVPGGFRVTGDFGSALVYADSVRLEVGKHAS